MFRKIIRLGNWLESSQNIYDMLTSSSQKLQTRIMNLDFIIEIVDLWTSFFDDVYCLCKMGVLRSKKLEKYSEIQASQAWFLSIILNLYVLYNDHVKLQSKDKIESRKIYWSKVSIAKLVFDGLFCSVDVFEMDFHPAFQTITGFMSGILS
jgi:hypothetical protein